MKKLEEFQQFAPQERTFSERKNALIYTRVSTKEQADTNTSLETQKKHCEVYAKNNGYTVSAYFGGTHESAKSDDRKEFKRIHEIFKNPFYCGILVCKMLPGEVIEGRHPKLVSQEDFLKINAVESNHPKKHISGNDNLPLKQFAYCDKCKTPLTGFLVKQKGIYYYKCRTKGCSCTKSAEQLHTKFEKKLKRLQVDGKYNDIIKDVMIYTYDSVTNEIRDKEASIKKQITELQLKLDALEERYAIGEIEKDIYVKFSYRFKNEVNELEAEIQNPEISSSNLQKAIDKALMMSSNLHETWTSGDLEQKRQLQNLVFPSGIGYDKQNDRVQTKRVNSIFSAIPLLTKDLDKIKSGEPVDFNQFSARVTSAGFKPATA